MPENHEDTVKTDPGWVESLSTGSRLRSRIAKAAVYPWVDLNLAVTCLI